MGLFSFVWGCVCTPPCTAVSYLFTYLLLDGYPGTR